MITVWIRIFVVHLMDGRKRWIWKPLPILFSYTTRVCCTIIYKSILAYNLSTTVTVGQSHLNMQLKLTPQIRLPKVHLFF